MQDKRARKAAHKRKPFERELAENFCKILFEYLSAEIASVRLQFDAGRQSVTRPTPSDVKHSFEHDGKSYEFWCDLDYREAGETLPQDVPTLESDIVSLQQALAAAQSDGNADEYERKAAEHLRVAQALANALRKRRAVSVS